MTLSLTLIDESDYICIMKHIERASIIRVLTDMVKADAIIDVRELETYHQLAVKYSLRKEDELISASLTLSTAINTLKELPNEDKSTFLSDFMSVAMSDDYLAREEALLLVALKCCLSTDFKLESYMLSLDSSDIQVDPSQILYVESEFNTDMNWEINESYRILASEIRLAGFDFVYLPKIAEHYRSIPTEEFVQIASFLYPKVGEERLKAIVKQLQTISTQEFCNDQLATKLSAKEFSCMSPSLMIKVGDSIVDDKRISNYLILELGKNVIKSVRLFIDAFSSLFHNVRLNYLTEEKGRFIYAGFYKQIFDLHMLRRGIKSPIVIDVYREEIRLPEADIVLDKLHRREKALYALFIIESASGGINFSRPESIKQFERYQKRMVAVQKKYRLIYKMFGGDEKKAPIIENQEIRNPMISKIKSQFSKYEGVLFHPENYTVQRNIYGNYSINIPSSMCYCCGTQKTDLMHLFDSIEWQNISAL